MRVSHIFKGNQQLRVLTVRLTVARCCFFSNNAGCNWDGGDCCGPKNYKYCKECKCKDCTYVKKGDKCVDDFKKSCGAPKFKGDGFCDGNNYVIYSSEGHSAEIFL